jgi:hypothetical protein
MPHEEVEQKEQSADDSAEEPYPHDHPGRSAPALAAVVGLEFTHLAALLWLRAKIGKFVGLVANIPRHLSTKRGKLSIFVSKLFET